MHIGEACAAGCINRLRDSVSSVHRNIVLYVNPYPSQYVSVVELESVSDISVNIKNFI